MIVLGVLIRMVYILLCHASETIDSLFILYKNVFQPGFAVTLADEYQ